MKPLLAWSYSRYALYVQCPLKFKLEVLDGHKKGSSPAMERGNVVHKSLADYITGKAEALPAEVKNAYQRRLYAEMRAIPADDKVVEQQMGFTRQWSPTGWFGKDTWLRVIWDAGFMYEDLTGEVVDHKTGKKYDSNDEQMELFGLSFFLRYRAATDVTTRLVYVDAGVEEIAEFSAADKPLLIDKWERKVRPMFEDAAFIARPNDKCGWCDFAKSKGGVCRFG